MGLKKYELEDTTWGGKDADPHMEMVVSENGTWIRAEDVAELEADKERLDWMEENDPMAWECTDPEGWSPCGGHGDPTYPTLRAAIDAAREAGQ